MNRTFARSLLAVAAAAGLALSASAHAQTAASAPAQKPLFGAGDDSPYPVAMPFLPVELAHLRSHVDLGFGFSNADFGPASINVLTLALDAQIALMDRFEIGLNVPFLNSAWSQSLGRTRDETTFGNISLNLKAQLWRSPDRAMAAAFFLNTTLPTASNLENRSAVLLHTGAAFSMRKDKLTVGGALGALIAAREGSDTKGIFAFDLFGAYQITPWMNAQLAYQMWADGDDVGVSVTPALQFFFNKRFHVEAGARIGLNDPGKMSYSMLGRAAFVLSGGMTF